MGVWIDTDMGFDDIAAVMIVVRHGIEIDGISLVFGNTSLEQVRRNAAGAISAFGWSFPVHTGRAMPVLGRLETATSILGDAGMPSAGLYLPEGDELPLTDAFTALCDWLEKTPQPRILALGPLTNIAALCLARPDLAARIHELVWMGGGVTTGNHTASAEFNAFADPEALAIVLAHCLPLKMVDLDICRKVLVAPDHVLPVREAGGRNAALLADLLEGFINIAISRGRPAMALYDPVAAVLFAAPETGTFREVRIDAELSGGFTRGRTVVETRAGKAEFNAHHADTIDTDAARTIILETLVAEAAR